MKEAGALRYCKKLLCPFQARRNLVVSQEIAEVRSDADVAFYDDTETFVFGLLHVIFPFSFIFATLLVSMSEELRERIESLENKIRRAADRL